MVILINTVKAFNKTAHLFLRKILRKPSSEKNVDKRNEKRRSLRTSGGRKMEKIRIWVNTIYCPSPFEFVNYI